MMTTGAPTTAGTDTSQTPSVPFTASLLTEAKKILVLGSAGSGKSALIQRFTSNAFTTDYQQTFGADMYVKQVTNGAKKRTLHIWSCAGHERYRSLIEQFYTQADAVLIVFDLLSQKSFTETVFWYNEVKRLAPHSLVVLIGTKSDDADNVKIKAQDVAKQAREWGIEYRAVSSKTGTNVNELFAELVEAIP